MTGYSVLDLIYGPPERHRAILWVVANVVIFRIQQHTNLILNDYMDFLLRSRWKLMRHKGGRDLVGNYLAVLDIYRVFHDFRA